MARIESITPGIIRSGFAAIGLVPYNPKRVLSKLNTQLRTPTPPPTILPELGRWVPETPYNTSQLELQARAIKEYISRCTKSPPSPIELALNQLVKGY